MMIRHKILDATERKEQRPSLSVGGDDEWGLNNASESVRPGRNEVEGGRKIICIGFTAGEYGKEQDARSSTSTI